MRKRSPKSESMPRNWARQALLKNFDFGQSQRSMVNIQWLGCWRYSRAYVAGRDTGRRVWHVGAHEAHDGDGLSVWGAWWRVMECGVVWSACSWDKNFSRRVGARVRWFLAVLGWLLLGIICSITLCLCFSSWMSRTMRSKSCRDCRRDSGNSLLIVTTGWRQRKNAGDVHRNQKVRGIALIPC